MTDRFTVGVFAGIKRMMFSDDEIGVGSLKNDRSQH